MTGKRESKRNRTKSHDSENKKVENIVKKSNTEKKESKRNRSKSLNSENKNIENIVKNTNTETMSNELLESIAAKLSNMEVKLSKIDDIEKKNGQI